MRHAMLCLMLLLSVAVGWCGDVEIRNWRIGGTVVKLVVIDPARVDVDIVLAQGSDPRQGVWRTEAFTNMVKRLQPLAAVTGTYFDPATKRPVCTLVSHGRLLNHGLCHGYVQFADGVASFGYQQDFGCGCRVNWPTGLPMAVCAGPILVRDGIPHENFHDEGFTRWGGVFGVSRRTIVGLTAAGKLILGVIGPVSVGRSRSVAMACGLKHAMLLDGGGSSGLYVDGDYLALPTRNLTNWIVVRPR